MAELHGVSGNPIRKTALSALSSDILNELARLLVKDELFNLILIGNRALISKLRYSTTVTAHWKSSHFCDWNTCLPFIKSFYRLFTLTMSTQYGQHITTNMLKLNTLPPTITSLSLHFLGSLAVLDNAKSYYSDLPSLTYLSLAEERQGGLSAPQKVSLRELPASLEHLHLNITPSTASCSYDLEDMAHLPPGLQTFDVNFSAKSISGARSFLLTGLPSLTFLSYKSFITIDIAEIAARLRHLLIFDASLNFRGEPIERLSRRQGLPIREILPYLETLVTSDRFPLHILETLPISCTRLGGYIGGNSDGFENTKDLKRMNDAHRENTKSEERPGAPRMLKILDVDSYSYSEDVLPLFESVETVKAYFPLKGGSTDRIPRSLRSINAGSISGSVALLPRSMTSLTCLSFAHHNQVSKSDHDSQALPSLVMSGPVQFPDLVTLSIQQSDFTSKMVAWLPRTLEDLRILVNTSATLEALEIRANVDLLLPSLKSLSVDVPFLTAIRAVPRSLTSLKLTGEYELPSAFSDLSLARHTNLTQLKLHKRELAAKVLHHLPKQLLCMSICLERPIDPSDPEVLDGLCNLPPALRKIKIRVHKDSSSPREPTWIHATAAGEPRSLRPMTVLKSRSWIEARFHLMKGLPERWITKTIEYAATESLVLSCLPRTVSHFSAPFEHTNTVINLEQYRPFLKKCLEELYMTNLFSFMGRLITVHVPLVGALLPSKYRLTRVLPKHGALSPEDRMEAMPPRMSFFEPHCSSIQLAYRNHLFGPSTTKAQKSQLLTARLVIHSINLIVWLQLRYMLQLDARAHPFAWSLMWSNLIGSAIALPAHAYVHRDLLPEVWSNSYQSRLSRVGRLKNSAKFLSYMLPVLLGHWATKYSAAVVFGYSGSNWSIASRVGASILTFVGESISLLLLRTLI